MVVRRRGFRAGRDDVLGDAAGRVRWGGVVGFFSLERWSGGQVRGQGCLSEGCFGADLGLRRLRRRALRVFFLSARMLRRRL